MNWRAIGLANRDRLELLKATLVEARKGRPLVVADGVGVDSTAMLILLKRLRVVPDLILHADTGAEKDETYDYLPVRRRWLRRNGFPDLVIVRYKVSDFKNWPPYHSLAENCLTNGTLPSLAFGFKSCSIKWKVVPQNRYTESWQPAIDAWETGRKVLKLIGFDAGVKDAKRFAHVEGQDDPRYDYAYILRDAGWDRDRCIEVIEEEGEPVPCKSACWMCPAAQPEELMAYKKKYLRWIVVMEARAEPRLRDIEGLWRNGVKGTRGGKKKPGSMTVFIREQKLLPAAEIDRLRHDAPKEILRQQGAYANGQLIPSWEEFLEVLAAGDACSPCRPSGEGVQLISLGVKREVQPRVPA